MKKEIKAYLNFWGLKDKKPQVTYSKLPKRTTALLGVIQIPCEITYILPE